MQFHSCTFLLIQMVIGRGVEVLPQKRGPLLGGAFWEGKEKELAMLR